MIKLLKIDLNENRLKLMAEEVRFELTEGYEPSTVFKTAALNRSATLPEREFYHNL